MTRKDVLCLVGISILLLTVLLPLTGTVSRQRAMMIVCQSNLSTIGRAWAVYAQDNDNRLTPSYLSGNAVDWSTESYCRQG